MFLTCSVSFKSISCGFFFFSKWRLKIFSGGNPPVPSDFDSLPYSYVRGTPGFFFSIKMTAKDVKEII